MLNRFFKSTFTDIKNIGAIFFVAPIIEAVLIIIMLITDKLFYFEFSENYAFCTAFYFIIDFIVPIIMMFNVLMLFSEEFKKSTFEFMMPFPLSTLHYCYKYVRLVLLLLIPHFIVLFLCNSLINTAFNASSPYLSLVSISVPTCLFLMSFALLAIAVSNKLFYSAVICCGYILIDVSSMGTIFNNKSIFISLYLQNYPSTQTASNRFLFLFLSLLFVALAIVILRIKLFFKKSGH